MYRKEGILKVNMPSLQCGGVISRPEDFYPVVDCGLPMAWGNEK